MFYYFAAPIVIQDYELADSARKNYIRIRNTEFNADPDSDAQDDAFLQKYVKYPVV
jgi:hypothetical protein